MTCHSNIVQLFAGENRTVDCVERTSPRFAGKSLLTIAACGLAALLFLGVRTAWYERSIETELGEWKTVTLADGSELRLGPNTRLTLDLGDQQRSIALVRGEAFFKVAKDATRPFLVEANAYAVRAVGTQFAVSHRQDELIVTVTEGEVRVTPSTKSTKRGAGDDEPARVECADHRRPPAAHREDVASGDESHRCSQRARLARKTIDVHGRRYARGRSRGNSTCATACSCASIRAPLCSRCAAVSTLPIRSHLPRPWTRPRPSPCGDSLRIRC